MYHICTRYKIVLKLDNGKELKHLVLQFLRKRLNINMKSYGSMVQETKMTDIHIGVRLWSLTSLLFLTYQTLFLLVYEYFYDV
jgi:hypothetical protein